MLKKVSLFLLIISLYTFVYAQSAEMGNAFNKYMSPEGGVNPINGSAAFSKYLASVTAGHAEAKFELMYSSNVSDVVKVKNDRANLGWIGLGWTLGQAKIVCNHNSNMWIGDDTYYLETASGVSYQIVKANGKWWIENLPYWTVERQTYTYSTNGRNYEIVKGWVLTDDSGVKYFYGEPDNIENRNSVEYVLGYPENYGIIGAFKGGKSFQYPCAWNLSKQEDFDGNFIKYEYDQKKEYVKIGGSYTDNPYTKENYLKKVTSSFGASIEFETSLKGQVENGADFTDELIDNIGYSEITNKEKDSKNDGYVDPMQRRYLSKMTVRANNGNIIEVIEFCYKPLHVRVGGIDNTKYVKRLLASVTKYDATRSTGTKKDSQNSVIDEEKYEYVDYENAAEDAAAKGLFFDSEHFALGAIKSITGLACGKVQYDYTQMSLYDKKEHKQDMPVYNANIGYLEDGSMFVVGTQLGSLQAYLWKGDGWYPMPMNNSFNSSFTDSETKIEIGQNNWFIVTSIRHVHFSDSDDDYDERTFIPYIWNGKEWIQQPKIESRSTNEYIGIGPGYIVKARVSDEKIKVSVPWTVWKTNGLGIVYTDAADDDDGDREGTTVITTLNHFAVYYKDKSAGESLNLKVFTFTHDRASFERTHKIENVDDDNQYVFLNDHIIGCAMEPDGAVSARHNARIGVLYWDESAGEWKNGGESELQAFQGVPTVQVVGDNYFAMKHNDHDDLTLLEFDETKHKYKLPYRNKNVVDGLNYDYVVEAEWNGYSSGGDYFVITRPKRKTLRKWGIKYGYAVRKNRKVQGFFKNENGDWVEGSISTFDEAQHVALGPLWYLLKESNQLYVSNGYTWNYEGEIKNTNTDERALSDDYFTVGTNLYFKKQDSFVNKIFGYLVSSKTVSDPVLDKEAKFEYAYRDIGAQKLEDSAPYYDFSSGMPVVKAYSITLPEGKGIVVKNLCPYKNLNAEKNGLAWGQICSERYYTNDMTAYSIPKKKITREFDRYLGKEEKWPASVYADHLIKVTTEGDNSVVEENYTYLDKVNGQQKTKKTTLNGVNISESYFVYAPEKYSFMAGANRLSDVIGSFQCVPECSESEGEFVSGTATILSSSSMDGKTIVKPQSQWRYAPKLSRLSKLDFDWLSGTQSENWKKEKSTTRYENGFEKEFVDEYSVKYSYIYENNKEKLLVATVKNAGLDEVVVVPGNKCELEDVKCSIDDMKMNSIEWKKQTHSAKYGKFSSKAISLNGNSLSAKIKKAKKGKYRFSAWVYSEGSRIRLHVTGKSDKFFDVEPSKWSLVEGDLDLDNSEYSVSISRNGNDNVWLQDVRLVPADAVVSVLFYDELWRHPTASVGDKEIAVYTQYDSKGRVAEIYSDYIKEDGSWDVALIERNTYVDGNCLDPSYDINTLSYISVNGDILTPNPNEVVYYNVLPGVDNLNITWKTHQEGKKVSYRIYEADKDDDDRGDFQTPICCSVQNGASTTFDTKDLVLELYVGDASDLVYKVKFSPQNFDWVNYGNALDVGKDPRFMSNTRINRVVYVGSEGFRQSVFDGVKWKNDEGYDGEFEKFCSAQKDDDKAYLSATRTDISKMSEQEWQFEISLDNQGEISGWNHKTYDNLRNVDAIDMAFVKDKLYTAYFKNYVPITGNNGVFPYKSFLYASKFDKDEKIVSEYHVRDFKIVSAPDNQPLIVYIGKLPSQFKEVSVLVDSEETLDDNQLDDISNIPSSMLQLVSVSDYYVVVKHLSSDGDWVGYSAEEGDYLTVNGEPLLEATRIALSSDEKNAYIAVLFETESGDNALSVYKSEKKDGKYSFNILNDAVANSSIVAYLDKNDPLDLLVYDGVPYLMFANKQNDNRVSVLTYNDDKDRWLSVGNPAFASIATSEKSGNLGFDKNKKTPVIVFKERYDSKRSSLRNKVVPMKYVDEGDMDVSLSSIGNSSLSVFAPQFRQYILSYSAEIDCDVNELVLNLQPIDDANIDKITFSVDGNEEHQVNPNADAKIPLPSKNVVNVKVNLLGKNGKRLTYQFNVNKTCPTSLKPSVSNSMNQNTLPLSFNSSSSSAYSSSSGNGGDFVYEVDGNDPYVCFSDYGHDWNFVAFDVLYTKYACVNWKTPSNPEANSSSSSYTPGSSSTCDYYFKNEVTGEERCVRLVIRSSSSSEGYPWWYNYSSSDPTSSGSTVNSSGSDVYSSGVNSTTSSTTDPTSSGSTINSSGSDVYSSGINSTTSSTTDPTSSGSTINSSGSDVYSSGVNGDDGESSSSFDPSISIPGTSIPQIYESIFKYKLASTGDLKFADNVNVSGNDFIGNNVEVGANSRISGQLTSTGNMLLRNNSYVEEIVVAGNLSVQNGAYFESETQQIVQTPLIPSVNFVVGVEHINVWNGQTLTLYPGMYKNLHVYSNATVHFEPGVYYFESFEIEADAMIHFKNKVSGIQIWIQSTLRIGDRVRPVCEGETDQLMIYSNTSQLVYLGVNSELKATMILPNGNINFAPNSTWVGNAWAKSVEIQPNVIVK